MTSSTLHVAALAALVHGLRPDWDEPGLRSVIHRARTAARTPTDVARAAVALAADERVRTPGALLADGPHWRGLTAAEASRASEPGGSPTPTPPKHNELCDHNWPPRHCPWCPGGRFNRHERTSA